MQFSKIIKMVIKSIIIREIIAFSVVTVLIRLRFGYAVSACAK